MFFRHYDFVDFGTGPDPFDPDTRLLHLSGDDPPIPFKTPTNSMWVTFASDYSKDEPGFNIQVSVDDETDGKNLMY